MNAQHRFRPSAYAIALLLVGLCYLLLELFTTPTLSDDIIYRFRFTLQPTAEPLPIRSLGDLLSSQAAHYMTINGRLPVHLFAQAFLVFAPAWLLDIVNTLLLVLMLRMSMSIVSADRRDRTPMLLLEVFFLFVVIRGFGTAFLWQLGTFNYLWPITLNLYLYLWLRRHASDRLSFRNAPFVVVALLAGWSHEALSLPVAIGLVAYALTHRRQLAGRAFLPCLLAYLAGVALCLCSPGLRVRVGDVPTLSQHVLAGVVVLFFNIRVGWILLFTVIYGLKTRRLSWSDLRCYSWVAVALLAAYGIVVLSGQTVIRVAFHAEVMALVVLLALWHRMMTSSVKHVLAGVGTVWSLVLYVPALLMCVRQTSNYRYALAQMQRPGQTLIATRQLMPSCWLEQMAVNRYVSPFAEYKYSSVYMAFDATDSNIRCIAREYGKPRMVFLPADVLARMSSDSSAFARPELDKSGQLYVWQQPEGRKVSAVSLRLKADGLAHLPFYRRPLAYRGTTYEIDSFRWETLRLYGRTYLVFTCPPPNVAERIDSVELK